MSLQIDFQAGKQVYLQPADQIRYAAAAGRRRPGEALPSLRSLTKEMRIDRNITARAMTGFWVGAGRDFRVVPAVTRRHPHRPVRADFHAYGSSGHGFAA
jgi:hypothetical protein